jgi:hypothetical protein
MEAHNSTRPAHHQHTGRTPRESAHIQLLADSPSECICCSYVLQLSWAIALTDCIVRLQLLQLLVVWGEACNAGSCPLTL